MLWTEEKVNEFLARLIGKPGCGTDQWSAFTGKYLTYEVVDFMEKELPELWNEYLTFSCCVMSCGKCTERLNQQLDPFNLVDYLSKYPEERERWGMTECPGIIVGCDDYVVQTYKECNGTGKIKTPALKWLEEQEGR
jgi:hypothetical protein